MSHSSPSPVELAIEMDVDWVMIDADDVDQVVDIPSDGVTNFDVEMTDAPALDNLDVEMTDAPALEQHKGQRTSQVKGKGKSKGKGQGRGQDKSTETTNEQAVSCEVEIDGKIVVRINVSIS